MPRLSDRLEHVLNEARMLTLGGQVLVGFTYTNCFENVFEKIPRAAQLAEVAALVVMSLGLCWLLWPMAFHQLAEHGWQTERMHSFTTRILDWGLLPFCLGIGVAFFPVAVILRAPQPLWIALAMGALTTSVWYAGAAMHRHNKTQARTRDLHIAGSAEAGRLQQNDRRQPDDLTKRIKEVLIECRVALPGAQAFLGFQFSIFFFESFAKLPRSSQFVHFASLISTTLAIVLLIAPAAYHRLAEGGEDSEHFRRVASRLLLAGLFFLAPGMAGDLYVVLRKVTGLLPLSLALAGGLLAGAHALWFVWSFASRRRA